MSVTHISVPLMIAWRIRRRVSLAKILNIFSRSDACSTVSKGRSLNAGLGQHTKSSHTGKAHLHYTVILYRVIVDVKSHFSALEVRVKGGLGSHRCFKT